MKYPLKLYYSARFEITIKTIQQDNCYKHIDPKHSDLAEYTVAQLPYFSLKMDLVDVKVSGCLVNAICSISTMSVIRRVTEVIHFTSRVKYTLSNI